MTNSFNLTSLIDMEQVNTGNNNSPFYLNNIALLIAHLRNLPVLVNFFETDEIRDNFISVFSRYMAYRCCVRSTGPYRGNNEEIRFFLPAGNELLEALHVDNVMYTLRSVNPQTFINVCTAFVERNIREFGLMTELWTPIPLSVFELLADPADTIALCVSVGNNPDVLSRFGETDRWFESWRRQIVSETYAQNNQHTVVIDSEPFLLTDDNKDDINECKLCFDESIYVCKDCKYPMCKTCLKHLLKSTGLCPSCRRSNITVQVISRSEKNKELIDDLNFDYDHAACEEAPTQSHRHFTPEQINEEIDYEINHPDGEQGDIELQDHLNDYDDDEDNYREEEDYREQRNEDVDALNDDMYDLVNDHRSTVHSNRHDVINREVDPLSDNSSSATNHRRLYHNILSNSVFLSRRPVDSEDHDRSGNHSRTNRHNQPDNSEEQGYDGVSDFNE